MEVQAIVDIITEWSTGHAYSAFLGLLALTIGWWLSKILPNRLRRMLRNSSAVDETIGPVLCQLLRYSILIVTTIIVLSQFGVATTSILAVLGAAGLAIALAMQGTLSNIAAGVMLIWLRPFSTGEYIEGNSISGTVDEIGLFATKLHTSAGLYLFVPNSELWNTSIINYSRRTERRIELKFSIAYESDIALARKVLLTLATREGRVLADPKPSVHVHELADSAVIIELRCWAPTSVYWDTKIEMLETALIVLQKIGIEIPYNKIDVNLSGAVQPGPAAAQPANTTPQQMDNNNPLKF